MNNTDQKTKVLLALCCVQELSVKKKTEFLDVFDEPEIICQADCKKSVERILGFDMATKFFDQLEKVDDTICSLSKRGIDWISIFDEEYPQNLQNIYNAPIMLFAKGDTNLLKRDTIAVVGTRRPTRYGQKIADEFTREFAKAGLCVVSGFARGVDSIAHKSCIDAGGQTIAVFASGLDVCYPAEHRGLLDAILEKGGLIVSEYPLGTKPLQYHFPERNRIISALARALFLPEAGKKSGSLITVNLATEQGKEIYITPGNIYQEECAGSNEYLRNAPHALVICAEDVLDGMRIVREVCEQEAVELSLMENVIVEALHDGELHFEQLLDATSLSVGDLTEALFNLQLNGIVNQLSGNFYELI